METLHSVEISWFFYHADFTWNQFWGFLKCKISHFNTFRGSEFSFSWTFTLFKAWHLPNTQNSQPLECGQTLNNSSRHFLLPSLLLYSTSDRQNLNFPLFLNVFASVCVIQKRTLNNTLCSLLDSVLPLLRCKCQ